MTSFHADTIREIEDAIKAHDVVVVGMSQNPHVKNVRKALDEAGVKFHYLEYGSYFSEWRAATPHQDKFAVAHCVGPPILVYYVLLGPEALARVTDACL